MRRYVSYKRVSSTDQGRSGLGLEAQERDIQLFLENYADTPFEVIGEFVEVQTGSDNDRPKLLAAIELAKRSQRFWWLRNWTDFKEGVLHRITDGRERP